MKYPIYIPTKNRANDCITAEVFKRYNIPFTLVVEPQDAPKYRAKGYDNLLILPENNQGLSYARSYIKYRAKIDGKEFCWQFDDDIKNFQTRVDGKNINTNPESMLNHIEDYMSSHSNIAIAGLRDSVFAWTQKEFKSINKLVASGFIVKTDVPVDWRKGVIEDIDYCLQCLFGNYTTTIFNTFLYAKKPNNVAKGGQQDDFTNYEQLNINTVKLWPEILKLRRDKKKGIMKLAPCRIWSSFTQRPIKK